MSYRPICLLNVMEKIMELLIKFRLVEEIKQKGDLAEIQYGFREGKSIIDAMKKVAIRAEKAKKEGKLYAITHIDVKKRFLYNPMERH